MPGETMNKKESFNIRINISGLLYSHGLMEGYFMKKFLIVLFMICPAVFGQTDSQNKQVRKLTLSQSIEIGFKNSKDLKISRAKLLSSKAEVTAATSQLLPQLNFNAGYMRLSNVPAFSIYLPPFIPKPITVMPVILDNWTMKLSLQQPLFTGFRLFSLRNAAKSNYKASEYEYNSSMNDESLKIQTSFWNYYKAELNDSVLGENLRQIKQHLDDTKNFVANGVATRNDLLKLEVQYSNTKLQKIEADNNLDIARATFNQTIGLPLEAQTEIIVDASETGNVEKSEYGLNKLENEAKVKRNELKAIEEKVNASDKGITAAKSGWLPSIYLVGDYYYSKPNQRYFPAVDKFKNTWDVGVQLNWSLWNWGYTSSQATIAEQNKAQVETSLSQLKDAVEIEVYQNYLTLNRAYDRVNVAKLGVKQAEENYRIIKDKYNTQVASSTDLIDAETDLLQTKTNYNNALVDYELAKVRLEKSVGNKIY